MGRVVDDVLLGVVVALAVFFAGALLDLGVAISNSFLLDGSELISLLVVFFIEGVSINGQTIEVLKVRQ